MATTLKDHRIYLQHVMSTTGARGTLHIEELVNETIREILQYRAWDFMNGPFQGRTYAKIDTGTISVNPGSNLVGLSGGTWHGGFHEGFLVITPTGSTATTDRYRIRRLTSTTQLELYAPWGSEAETIAPYAIFQDKYFLPEDCESVYEGTVWYERSPFRMQTLSRRAMEIIQFDNVAAEGDPWYYIDDIRSQRTFLSSPGTVGVVDDSFVLTGTGTSWTGGLLDADAPGDVLHQMPVKLATTLRTKSSRVLQVTGPTQLTLERDFHGATESGLTWKFAPSGSKMIQFLPSPDTARAFGGWYRKMFLGLYDDSDESPIPEQYEHIVNQGAAYRVIRRLDTEETDMARAGSYKNAYVQGLSDMAANDNPNMDRVNTPTRHDLAPTGTTPEALRNYGWFPASG